MKDYDFETNDVRYVTICLRDWRPVLGKVVDEKMILNQRGQIVAEQWWAMAERQSELTADALVVMPSHIHGIVVWQNERSLPSGWLGAVVNDFKAAVGRRMSQEFEDDSGQAFWQNGFYERTIGNRKALGAFRRYIANNPATWMSDPLNAAVNDPSCFVVPAVGQ